MCTILPSQNPSTDGSKPIPIREPLAESAGNRTTYSWMDSNGVYNNRKLSSLQSYNESLKALEKKLPSAVQDERCPNCEMGFGVDCAYHSQSQNMGYNGGNLGYGEGTDRMSYSIGLERPPQSHFTTVVPSQRFGRHRRKGGKRRKTRNPISQSVQYQAYRSRQTKEGTDDQKWSDSLEELFLDAMLAVPPMGRRKFSFGGKPHGRNELISLYLWIGYKNSLPLGVKCDDRMKRTRKQVSSHIQVLKNFMKDDPAYELLFPPTKPPGNGFEDSLKDNKTLQALAAGRLPILDYEEEAEEHYENLQPLFLKPSSFEMFVEITDPDNGIREPVRIHDYSRLSRPPFNGSKQSIDMVRHKFPELEELEAKNSLPPCVIHLDVGINLMKERPDGAVLNTRVFLQANSHPQTRWETITTLVKPECLSGPDNVDLPIYRDQNEAACIAEEDGTIKIHISFPALPWAHAFMQLIDLHDDTLLETITMYQEIRSASARSENFTRRAILLWTFHKSQAPVGETTWRYIGPPERNQVFSPGIDETQGTHSHHSLHSVLHDNSFSTAWDDQVMAIPQGLVDPFYDTQPHSHQNNTTAAPVLRSPFNPHYQYNNNYDISVPHASTPSQSQDSSVSDTGAGMVNFDGSQALDIQLSYDAVGGGGGVGVGLEGFEHAGDVDRNAWMGTPTPIGGVSEGFEMGEHGEWGYEGLEHGGVGHGWDEGDLGVGVGVGGGFGNVGGGGNISVGGN